MKKALLLCALPFLAACAAKSEGKSQAAAADTTVAAVEPSTALPPNHPPIGTSGGNDTAMAPSEPVSGTVLETLEAGSFTYVRFKTATGERWAAIGRTELARGTTITIAPNMVADRFASQPLGRTFDNLIFGALKDAAPSAGGGSPSPHATAAAQPAPAPVRAVARAEGNDAKTVAELWEGSPAIRDGQRVVVRGTVVKVLRGIMDRNWIHLRDGSGTPGKDDITVTSQETPSVGSIVTATGTVHLNRDFGSGYNYPVLIEEASFR
ncbi:MAG TPA: hypothetical protein VGQ76_09210 [Thermoanaerobaculia bacterium]|jgi:hypothetical protein|nr:hypothetical protein [Thermoanaerobaculia bacterium]